MFAINVTNNGGLDYQYDEVIRNRNARKNMHADDCECCREVCIAYIMTIISH